MIGWQSLLAVALGGGIGSLLRYIVTFAVTQRMGPGFPWATLIVNVTGSFIIGLVAEITQTRAFAGSPVARVFLMTGILGGYTTFSTFSFDAMNLLRERAELLALGYAVGSVCIGIAAAFAGSAFARTFSAA